MKNLWMNKLYFISICFLWIPVYLDAQEVIIPVSGNPEAKEYYDKTTVSLKKAGKSDTLELPFIDDFSDSYVEPDPDLWSDKRAYINNTYSLQQVTAGMATMDAYDPTGAHYPNAGRFPYIADYLTSHPINLDYPSSDNIFLSFYYQAKGLGEMPDKNDSLCLEFQNPGTQEWDRIWAVPGDTLMNEFSQVILRIEDEKYLQNGFRFRFLNYASQPANGDYRDMFSNVDHWHIDYVRLDRNRSFADTVLRDVAFTLPLNSLLIDYESIPWKHFEAAYFTQRQAFIQTEIANYDTLIRNVTKTLQITDLYEDFTYSPTPTANDVLPGEIFKFNFEYDYPFDFETGDSALFRIKTILRTDAFDYKPNDTLEYTQIFKNYYAYDDGSAEAGYGLRGQGTQNASVAVAFNAFNADSLRAVDMYFNQVIDSLNRNFYFYLNVWEDNNGRPGNLIYSQLGVRPEYSPLNELVRYELDSAIAIKKGIFYVGWRKTVDQLSNIGLDLNRNNSENNFYTVGGEWLQSSIPGAIMLRPVLSKTPLKTSIEETLTQPEYQKIHIYPNPADNYIELEMPEQTNQQFRVALFDLGGRMVYRKMIYPGERINTEELENGIYFLKASPINGIRSFTQKIIIQH